MTLELGILISGRGSNLQAILDAVERGALDARVRVVISNRADAPGLTRAAQARIPTATIAHRDYSSREAFDAALVEALRGAGAELIVLAGFMRVLTPVMIGAYHDRIINIHPSLLPAFPGAHAHRDALAYGVKVSGCTVHFVDEGTDTGPIIRQRAVPVLDDDDEERLAARVLAVEHALLVEALAAMAEGRVSVEPGDGDRRARVVERRG
ncbi:MAG: phosphoribosylglycinamide formyltransferase [Sorangiineae bacterium]|nr:phosphoribosylglycinamide formyltransferase [Polyangiaceae bacterium]MEB2322667.1 phosphoribosylglycinamide formyltransferase [Sorangiineae bacterium]